MVDSAGQTLHCPEREFSMAIVAIFDVPGMTQAQYEQSAEKVSGRPGPVKTPADWPVPGLISHTSAPTADGWLVVDVWESKEAFQEFGKRIVPILQELGVRNPQPKIYPAFTVVSR
jgi:heme-degrading monooxygenase HmoA